MGGNFLNVLLFGTCLLPIDNYDSWVVFCDPDANISCFMSMECQYSVKIQPSMFGVCAIVSTTAYC